MRSSWLIVAVGCLAFGCAHRTPVSGEEKIIERSGEKPQIVRDNRWSDARRDPHLYVGMTSGAKELDAAVREAELKAHQRIAESLSDSLRSVGAISTAGGSDVGVGRYLNDVFSWAAGNVEVAGVRLVEAYWEKRERWTPPGVEYTYQVYAVVGVPKAEIAAARLRALQRAEERAKVDNNADARKIIQEMIAGQGQK
jgi:hypothetical protein